MLRLYKILASLLLVAIVPYAFSYAIGDAASQYNVQANTSQVDQLVETQRDLQTSVGSLQNETKPGKINVQNQQDIEGGIFSQALSAIASLPSTIANGVEIIVEGMALTSLPVPAFVTRTLVSVFMVTVVTGIVFTLYFKVRA